MYTLPWVSLRIALSTFRSHETCKVEIQYLKRVTQIRKNYVNVKHFACVISGSLHNKSKVLADKDQ